MKDELKFVSFRTRLAWSVFVSYSAGIGAGFYWEDFWVGFLVVSLVHVFSAPDELFRR